MTADDRMVVRAELVRDLLSRQFPQWADLPIAPVEPGGWSNRTFRLGPSLVARLPAAARYAAQVAKEARILPRLAPLLPLPIPEPVAIGKPSESYPWPWAVYRWIEGESAETAGLADPHASARQLAAFLRALWQADTVGGPPPGAHNFHRGGDLAVYDSEVRRALAVLGPDGRHAPALWQAALDATWQGTPVWVHGDFSAGNLVIRDGRIAAVIDFGNTAVGDPACDLALAWTHLSAEARTTFLAALAADPATVRRGQGWVLWKALIVLAGLPGTDPRQRPGARRALDAVLSDPPAPPA